jgi:hypothetical protein
MFSQHRLKTYFPDEQLKRKSRTKRIVKNLRQKYRSLCVTVTLVFRLFIYIDTVIKEILRFIEKIIQIIVVIYGWIQMIRAILSGIHLIISRIMIFTSCVHRIFSLLSILFEPLSNRTFEKGARSFSHFVFYYYSSNGACYTLQARTRHIVGRVRARWKRKGNCIYEDVDDEIYYDAFSEEYVEF